MKKASTKMPPNIGNAPGLKPGSMDPTKGGSKTSAGKGNTSGADKMIAPGCVSRVSKPGKKGC